jgi:hypothetical protein
VKKSPVSFGLAVSAAVLLLASLYPTTSATSADSAETLEHREARLHLEVLHADIDKMKAHGIGMEETRAEAISRAAS